MREKGIISPSLQEDDRQYDASLRPRRLEDFTGQSKLKENLAIAIEDEAKARYDAFSGLTGGRYDGDASDMFRAMATNEVRHGQQLSDRRRCATAPPTKPVPPVTSTVCMSSPSFIADLRFANPNRCPTLRITPRLVVLQRGGLGQGRLDAMIRMRREPF